MLVFWILLIVSFTATLIIQKSMVRCEHDFDPDSYTPSSKVVDALLEEDEVKSIRLIREETGLGLKQGRDLYRKYHTDY